MKPRPLTDTKRLAYTPEYEAQESSGSEAGTQGRTCSDEENDIGAADRSCAPSGKRPLEQEKGKERVKLRRSYMTRSSFQQGYVFARETKRGKIHVIRYRIRIADGTWRHKAETVNSPKRKHAERLLAERLREVNRGLTLPAEITFEAFATDHWTTYVRQNLKPSTQLSHNSNLNKHLLPVFGTQRLSQISALQIMTLFKDKAVGGLKPKSLLNLYVLLQKMLNLAVALELISANPIQRVPKPKVERAEKPSLAPEQVRKIADQMPANLRALIVLLYLTGLRIGETLALKWSDVDFERSCIYIRRSIWRGTEQTPKSRRSVRAQHLLPGLKEALERHRALFLYTGSEDYVFTNGSGGSLDPDDLRKCVLYPAMNRAKIERKTARSYGFHLFRHSAGSLMQEATGDLKQTQNFLGHSGIGITGDVYVHLQLDSEVSAIEKLEKSYFGTESCSSRAQPDSKDAEGSAN
jgi:integrase